MSSVPSAIPMLYDTVILWGEAPGAGTQAAARRPLLEEEGGDVGPPPAAVERAQKVFEGTGFTLFFLILAAAAWILIRGRL